MTKLEIVSRFLEHKGYKVIQGKLDENTDIEAIIPWLLMDLQKTMYDDHIKNLMLKHQLKTDREKWNGAYLKFNDKVFEPFREEEHGEIIEFMDSLESYMRNDMALLRLAVMEMVPTESLAHKQVVSASYVCYVLTEIAKTMHHKIYKEVKPLTRWQNGSKYFQEFTEEKTPELDQVATCTARWTTNYVRQNGIGNVYRSEKIEKMTSQICRKVVKWLKEVA